MKRKLFTGKKLIRIIEWYYRGCGDFLFEFEEDLSLIISDGNSKEFETCNDLILFLDKQPLSEHFYTDLFYRKRTALEEYSREVLGSVEKIYKKHCDIISVNCNHCIWARYKEEKYCRNCWCYGWG